MHRSSVWTLIHTTNSSSSYEAGYSYSKVILMQSMDSEFSSSSFLWLCRDTWRCRVAMSVTYFMLYKKQGYMKHLLQKSWENGRCFKEVNVGKTRQEWDSYCGILSWTHWSVTPMTLHLPIKERVFSSENIHYNDFSKL